uniref:6-hydroxymethylpterin diphosphokinase MptE-like domain-containing protein n=1 Tax=Cyanothece sp. (strain PCC 7425 / ATCC 29141) TaxID=395961 RepID=B8HNB5_CYAP4
MQQFLKSVAYWTLPPGVQDSLKGMYRLSSAGNHNSSTTAEVDLIARNNAQFRDIHKGERCFILATGPSINQQDLSVLKNELCIAVSHFFLHQDIKVINPKYHVLAPYHPPFNFETIKTVFEGFIKNYSDEMIYFFGHSPYEYSVFNFLKQSSFYRLKNTHFINYIDGKVLDEDNYTDDEVWDISRAPFKIRTVIYSAIQLALYMGCREIYLIGCDHDYLNDTSRVTNHHFYKEEDGVSDAQHLSSFTTERWFEEYYLRWKHYRLMREYARLKNCKIINATHGGMLDVFPRVELTKIFT